MTRGDGHVMRRDGHIMGGHCSYWGEQKVVNLVGGKGRGGVTELNGDRGWMSRS